MDISKLKTKTLFKPGSRLILSILLFSSITVFANNALSTDSVQNDGIVWKTYNSSIMQISFSYPSSWTFIPENPDRLKGSTLIFIKDENVTIALNRFMDNNIIRNSLKDIPNDEAYRARIRGGFQNEISIVIGNDTCIEVIDTASLEAKEPFKTISVISVQKLLMISVYFYNYTPNINNNYMPIINKMLSSVKINGTGAASWRKPGDYSNAPIEWRTYHSREMGISFNYPACWTFEPENPANEGKITIEGKGRISIYRDRDTIMFRQKMDKNKRYYNMMKENANDYNEKKILIDKMPFEKISFSEHNDRGKHTIKNTEMYCPGNGLFFSGSYATDISGNDTTASIVDSIFSSVKFEDRSAK